MTMDPTDEMKTHNDQEYLDDEILESHDWSHQIQNVDVDARLQIEMQDVGTYKEMIEKSFSLLNLSCKN